MITSHATNFSEQMIVICKRQVFAMICLTIVAWNGEKYLSCFIQRAYKKKVILIRVGKYKGNIFKIILPFFEINWDNKSSLKLYKLLYFVVWIYLNEFQ